MIRFVEEIGSTSAELAARLVGGVPVAEGEWLVADRQTAGRGRQGRAWFDGAGNFMGSTVVHRRAGDPEAATLALAAGLALQAAIAPLLPDDRQAVLKWPNDLMIGPAKVAGILLEREGDPVIIGIGVNLASAPVVPGRQTIALAELAPAPDCEAFAGALAEHMEREIGRWRNFGLEPILRRWMAAAHPVGTPLSVVDPGEGVREGAFAGLTEAGELRLREADGSIRVIRAGEVHFAGQADRG